MERFGTASGRKRLFSAMLAAIVAILSFMPSALAAAAPAEVDVESAMAGVTVEIFKIDDRNAKLTVRGLSGAIEALKQYGDSDENTFRYSVKMFAPRGIELYGSLYYEPKQANPYLSMSSFLKCNNYNTYDARDFYVNADGVNWMIHLPRWVVKDFDFNDVKEVEVSLHNAVRSKVAASKTVANPDSDAILTTSLKTGGTLQVVALGKKKLEVHIGDPALPNGYPISPDAKGTKTPVWYVKAVINSYLWVEITVDGREATSFDDMKVTAGEFHLLKYETNKYHPKSFALDGCACRVEDGVLIMELTVPDDLIHNFRALRWIEVAMDGRVIDDKYVVAH